MDLTKKNIFSGDSMDAQCARAWDDLLRKKEWVSSEEVRKHLGFREMNGKTQKACLQSIRDAKAMINAELGKRGMALRLKPNPADKRQLLTAYPEEDLDPLHNLRILPVITRAIEDGLALRIWYSPSFHRPQEHVLHAHYVRAYNNRTFVYGRYDREEDNRELPFVSLPIDRIESCEPATDVVYQPRGQEYYKEQLRYVVGASPNFKDPEPMQVLIRTHSAYKHKLMLSKPLHWTLREKRPYSAKEPGLLSMLVQNTIELRSWLIHYGASLEVVAPWRLREAVRREILSFCERYDISIKDTEKD